MDNECLVRLTTVREWCSNGRNDNEMYMIVPLMDRGKT